MAENKKIRRVSNPGPIFFYSECARFAFRIAFTHFSWSRMLAPIVIGALLFFWRHSATQDWKDNLAALAWIIPLSVFLSVALVGIFYAPYYLWKQVGAERDNLNQKLATLSTPRLEAQCSPDIAGCVVENVMGAGYNLAFRVAVKTASIESVTGCKGQLIEIKKGSSILWGGDIAILTFAKGEDPDSMDRKIAHRETACLDVLFHQYDTQWNILRSFPGTKDRNWNYLPRWETIFADPGEYTLKIQILAPPTPTLEVNLKYTWTGDETSRMDLVK
jgi:hypothetical protein